MRILPSEGKGLGFRGRIFLTAFVDEELWS
jgi:hypothetical protein